MTATLRLVGQWPEARKSEEYLQSVSNVLRNFSLEILDLICDEMQGLSANRAPNVNPNKLPTVPEIRAFCRSAVPSSYRPPAAPKVEPERSPPNAEDRARVQAIIAEMVAHRKEEDRKYREEMRREMEARHREAQELRARKQGRAEAQQTLDQLQATESLRRTLDHNVRHEHSAEEHRAWLADPPLG
jgi:hypothetical protein